MEREDIMGKLIRRCGSFLMMLLLVIGILPMTVNAETTQNTEERNALYVQVPEDWENPCVWAWDSDGNNAFTAWPGEEMEADAANDGWYYIWLPAWANHVIINANEVKAFVPLAEMFGYSTDLRSKTQGRGNYSMFFEKYEPVPKNVQEKVLAAKAK